MRDCRAQLIVQRSRIERTGPAPRDYHQVSPARQLSPQSAPECLADTPLDSVAHHRAADLAGDRDSDSHCLILGDSRGVRYEMRGLETDARALRAQVFAPPM